jgi:iron complex transport system substrate-binding protein
MNSAAKMDAVRHGAILSLVCAGAVILGIACVLTSAGIGGDGGAGRGKGCVVVDMVGRNVAIPDEPRRVVTIGAAPILNTFVFALGMGETIANGLPATARANQKDCCRFQGVFAPQLNECVSVEAGDGGVDMETLLLLRPDLIVTGMKRYLDVLKPVGIPVIYVEIGAKEDRNGEIMALLGKVYHREREADAYIRYSNSVARRVRARISDIPEKKRTRVLYCNFKSLTQSSPTADWLIVAAGGISLAKGGLLRQGVRVLSPEHVLAWDPDIWIVSTPGDIAMVYRDSRFQSIRAVRDGRVFSVPVGSLRWSHPTAEKPLGILWAARLFYPERFKDLNIEKETRDFYGTFFGYRLTEGQIREILTGTKQ